MVFHTGAALLDAIVLAVVSMEENEGTYGYRITQDVRKVTGRVGVDTVSGAAKAAERMRVWKYMIGSSMAETDGIIR